MKPILFAANATNFTTNGLGQLDPTSCVVTEERNGQYELICVVPVDSVHYSDIENNMILAVVPGDGMNIQAFRIYQITEPMNGLVAIAARHISYDLSYNTVMPFEAASCTAALSGLESHVVESNLFDTWTDKSVVQNFKVSTPQTFRACLGGQRGSILDVYGGEYEWDNFTVKLYVNRGQSTNVTLRYGKNITDISQEQNLENVVTGIVPFWASEDTVVTLPEKSVDSAYASQYPYKRTVPIDFSNEWEGAPTESQLRARAQSYITANNIGVPKVSIKVSFVALWQTEEYKNIAPLERVHLCDTVGVVFDKYGIDARAKVIKTEWDCLAERYLSIELGEARSNLASTLVSMNEETTQEVIDTKSELQQAIDRATNTITGANGGWVKLQTDADGKPTEILIMDTDDIDTAQKIWRWNLGGLGYSKDGYEGPYGTAMTMKGEIVANFITTGEMSANHVRAGSLVSTAKRTGTQIPVTTFNLDTGKLSTVDGEFSGTITNYEQVSQNYARRTIISGASIESQFLQNGAVIQNCNIKDGAINAYSLTSERANIQSIGTGNNAAVLNNGELKLLAKALSNPESCGVIYALDPYGTGQLHIDSQGHNMFIESSGNNGNLYIGDNKKNFNRMVISVPLNTYGIDAIDANITIDGHNLTFKNGLLTRAT
jgi:phage minor structural protein